MFKIDTPWRIEVERLRENVAFWKDKVDSLLKEKSEQLLEKMNGHKTIRDLEQMIEQLKVTGREKDLQIETL